MNINHIGSIPKSHLPAKHSSPSGRDSKTGEVSTGQSGIGERVKASLIERLTAFQDESRLSLLTEIKAKVQSGYYLARSSAETVADRIVDG